MKRILPAVLLVSLLIAGCSNAKPQQPAQHPCSSQHATMNCVLRGQHPPRLLGLGAAVAHGIDFAWSCPNPSGWGFGASYLSPDPSKNWSRSCVARWHAAGAKTVPVWESTANRAEQGFNAGFNDAFRARAQARGLGMPNARPIDFAVDCDCSLSSITGYFSGVDAGTSSVLHVSRSQAVQLVGVYGGYYQVRGLHNAGLVGHTNWQTYAWSGGRWLPASIAPLEQYLNSNAVDYDRAIAPDYGQWPIKAVPPPPPPDPYAIYDKTVRHFPGRQASEYGTVKRFDQLHCSGQHPVRPVCKQTVAVLRLLRGRLWTVAHRNNVGVWGVSPTWGLYHRGARFQGLQHRIHQR